MSSPFPGMDPYLDNLSVFPDLHDSRRVRSGVFASSFTGTLLCRRGQSGLVAIPLLPGDGAVALDLQAVFDRCYDVGSYRCRVRNGEEAVVPPLSAEPAVWAT